MKQVYMILRPYVKEFLQAMAKIYEVWGIWLHLFVGWFRVDFQVIHKPHISNSISVFSSCLFTRARKKNTPRRSWRSWTLRENCFGTFQREMLSRMVVTWQLFPLGIGQRRLMSLISADTVCTRTTALVSSDTTSKTSASSGGTSLRLWP